MTNQRNNFDQLGGRKILVEMSKVFYDKIYAHEWLGLYFKNIPQEVIESQQVDFLQGALGGEKVYCGKLPIVAHKHIFITEELLNLRQDLLIDSLNEVNACKELIDKILRIDNSFKSALIKKSVDECQKRFPSDEIIVFQKPELKLKLKY